MGLTSLQDEAGVCAPESHHLSEDLKEAQFSQNFKNKNTHPEQYCRVVNISFSPELKHFSTLSLRQTADFYRTDLNITKKQNITNSDCVVSLLITLYTLNESINRSIEKHLFLK